MSVAPNAERFNSVCFALKLVNCAKVICTLTDTSHSSTGLPSASPSIPKSPTTAGIPLPASFDRSISAMSLAPAASTKPATGSGTPPVAGHGRSISVGSRTVTDEVRHENQIVDLESDHRIEN
jgi:hypothetical protein